MDQSTDIGDMLEEIIRKQLTSHEDGTMSRENVADLATLVGTLSVIRQTQLMMREGM